MQSIVTYFTLIRTTLSFEGLTFEIFEMQGRQINFGNHVKTLDTLTGPNGGTDSLCVVCMGSLCRFIVA